MSHVMGVLGPIKEEEFGLTLPHEHVFLNLGREYRFRGLFNDYDVAVQEVAAFRDVGGRTIVDVTSQELTPGAAPDPSGSLEGVSDANHAQSRIDALCRVAQETAVNIVAGTGHYRDPYLDRDWFDRNDPDAIAEQMIGEVETGIAGSSARAGVIGEIGADKWYISAAEERSFRAAARTHHATGLTITTHAARWPIGILQLQLLESEGVRAERIIIGHCDQFNDGLYHEELARRGAWVQFDSIRGTNEFETQRRLKYVLNMINKGWQHRVLLSQDVCHTEHLTPYGGNGFRYVATTFADLLADAGVERPILDLLMVENPWRALSGA